MALTRRFKLPAPPALAGNRESGARNIHLGNAAPSALGRATSTWLLVIPAPPPWRRAAAADQSRRRSLQGGIRLVGYILVPLDDSDHGPDIARPEIRTSRVKV